MREQERRMLLPGLRVLGRGRDAWQLGIDPATAVVVRRDKHVDNMLDLLADTASLPTEPRHRKALAALDGLTVPLPGTPTSGLDVLEQAAVLQRGAGAERRLAGRAQARVAVTGSWGATAEELFAGSGIRLVEPARATALLHLADGEADRDVLDAWVRRGLPHLVVRRLDGAIVLGPFVVPGQTACLRCLDAHLAETDPLYPAMVVQHQRALAEERRDGCVEPVDRVLATLASAWAVRDLVSFVEGDRPTTWSTTIRIAPGMSQVTDVLWLRHAQCGCSWDAGVGATSTMEA